MEGSLGRCAGGGRPPATAARWCSGVLPYPLPAWQSQGGPATVLAIPTASLRMTFILQIVLRRAVRLLPLRRLVPHHLDADDRRQLGQRLLRSLGIGADALLRRSLGQL